jgi:hypothetical protein
MDTWTNAAPPAGSQPAQHLRINITENTKPMSTAAM